MALTEPEVMAFRLHRLASCYLWPIPIKWNKDHSKLLIRPIWESLPFFGSVISIPVFAAFCSFQALRHTFWSPIPNIGRINEILVYACTVLSTGVSAAYLAGALAGRDIVCLVNDLITLSRNISAKYPNNTHGRRERSIYERMQVINSIMLVPCGAFFPYANVIGGLYMDIDPIHGVLEYFLPDPMYRTYPVILAALAFRAIILFLCNLEFIRIIVFVACALFVILDRMETVMNILITRIEHVSEFYMVYSLVRIMFAQIIRWLNFTTFLAFAGLFWGCVLTCWVSIRLSPEEISWPVYLAFFMGFVVMLVGNKVCVPVLCETMELLVYAPQVNRLRAELRYAKRRTVDNRIMLMKVRSVLPVRVKYAEYWYLGTEFVPEYLWLIFQRCSDALLIFV